MMVADLMEADVRTDNVLEETAKPPVHAERRRFPLRSADEARVSDLSIAFGSEHARRVDLADHYPFAEEMRRALWDNLCRVGGEMVEPGTEDAALLDNLLLVNTQDLRRKLAEGFGPEVVAASEVFSRWKEISDFVPDAEAFDLSIELNDALRKQPEMYYETRLALRECEKDLNNELRAPLEKNVLQSVHVEGVTDLCTEHKLASAPTAGGGEYPICVDAGEFPLVGLMAELHDFVKLNDLNTYVWEHEALSAIATVRLADELLVQLRPKLSLAWLGDETKRRKVAMLMAKAVASHGDREYPHAQVLKGGDAVEVVEHQGVRIAKIEGFGTTNFFIEPPSGETLVSQIPNEIRADPDKFRLAKRFMTGVRDEDRKDGCGGYAELKYYLQFPPTAIFEGSDSWDNFVEKNLLGSFSDNLKTAGNFDIDRLSVQEKRVIYPTMLFAALTRQIAQDFESKQLSHESEWRRWYIFDFDKTAPYVGESSISAGMSARDKQTSPGFVDGRKHYSFFQNAVSWLCKAEEVWREQRKIALGLREADEQQMGVFRQGLEEAGIKGADFDKVWLEKVKQTTTERQKKLIAGKDELFGMLRNGLQDLMTVNFDHEANQEAVEMADGEMRRRLA